MSSIRRLALATVALVALAVPSHAAGYDTVKATTSDVNCNSDDSCKLLATVFVNDVTLGGVTGTARYVWQTDRTSCTTDYIRPTGTSAGQFCRKAVPATGLSGLGTGVATALGVNPGSTGAVVVNGGAGGTPASLNLTNATGLPLTTGVTGFLAATKGGSTVINFDSFSGADPTGVTDNSAAFASAISAALATPSKCATIQLSKGGVYLLSAQVLVQPTAAGACVVIDGNNATISIDPRNWTFDGSITHFWAAFSTVNVLNRPQQVWDWRANGSGAACGTNPVCPLVLTYHDVTVKNLTIQLNRDPSVPAIAAHIATTDFDAIRCEDVIHCKVENVKFMDKQTAAYNIGTAPVAFVRCSDCGILKSYEENTMLAMYAEVIDGYATDNYALNSVTTTLESIAGERIRWENNFIGPQWWVTSSIGMNSLRGVVKRNIIPAAGLAALTMGHAGGSNSTHQYSVSTAAAGSVAEDNLILGAGSVSGQGNIGFNLQQCANCTIRGGRVTGLNVSGSYYSNNAVINIPSYSTDDNSGIIIDGVYVNGGDAGVSVFYSSKVTIQNSVFKNVLAGVYSQNTDSNTAFTLTNNVFDTANIALNIQSGSVVSRGNTYANVTVLGGLAMLLKNGSYSFKDDTFTNFVGLTASTNITRFWFEDNYVYNSSPITNMLAIDGGGGLLTLDKLVVHGNIFPGATHLASITNMTGQADFTIDTQAYWGAKAFRMPSAKYAEISNADPSPMVNDQLVISDASACTANTAVTAGGGTGHSCWVWYNGSSWIAVVTH